MINNANAYGKCENCDINNGNYSNKGTNNDKNKVSAITTALHSDSNTSAQKEMKKNKLQDFVDSSRFG